MKKYLDTSNLIKFTSGRNNGKIDWMSNVGKKLYFEYDDISGYLEITDYKLKKMKNKSSTTGEITIKYQDKEITTGVSNLKKLSFSSLFNKEKNSKKYKYNIGDIIDKDIQSSKVISRCRLSVKSNKKYETTRGYDLEYISNKMGKSIGTVQGKLRLASKYDLCIYDKNNNMKYGVINPNKA